MQQTKLSAAACDETPNDNVSIPYGTVRAVSHYLELTGVLGYVRRLKSKGVRLDRMVVAMCVFTMYASNSLSACAEWISDPAVRKCLGFKIGEDISQRTLNRGLELLGRHREASSSPFGTA